MSSLKIHPPNERDFSAIAQIYNEIYTDRPTFTAAKIQASESQFPKNLFREYLVVEQEGEIVASAVLTQDQHYALPGWYSFNIWVNPSHQGKGIGRAVFDHLLTRLSALNPKQLQCALSEKFSAGLRFLGQRNFRESHRNFESRLKISRFDPEKYSALEPKLNAAGIILHELHELDDPLHLRKIYELQAMLEREVPGAEQRSVMGQEEFWAKVERDLPAREQFSVAMKDGQYIGLHFGSCPPGSEWFMVRVAGVLPQYRNLGVATALKVRGLSFAKQKGLQGAFTWNDSRNLPILALNTKFGFERQPATITFGRSF